MYNIGLNVLNRIEEYGYKAYIIGGYPRDLYLKRGSTDIDVCTDATPMEIIKIFPDVVTTNFEYGSVTILHENVRIEITTFRSEGKYINNRKPSVIKYVDSLEEDLKRRDFTINTLCIDKEGKQIDLLNAKSDLDNKIIRMVGNPKIKLKEDALRILRAIRFATILNFELEPVLKAYIKKYNGLVRKLSAQRRREELDIIFASSNKEYGIKLLNELKLSDSLEIPNLKKIMITPSMIVTWALLDVTCKYPFNAQEQDTIFKILKLKDRDILDRRVIYEYGLYVCSLVCEVNDVSKKELNEIYLNMPIHSRLDIKLKPEAICEILGKEPGKFIRDILNDVEEKILDNTLDNDEEILKNYLIKNYL